MSHLSLLKHVPSLIPRAYLKHFLWRGQRYFVCCIFPNDANFDGTLSAMMFIQEIVWTVPDLTFYVHKWRYNASFGRLILKIMHLWIYTPHTSRVTQPTKRVRVSPSLTAKSRVHICLNKTLAMSMHPKSKSYASSLGFKIMWKKSKVTFTLQCVGTIPKKPQARKWQECVRERDQWEINLWLWLNLIIIKKYDRSFYSSHYLIIKCKFYLSQENIKLFQ